MNTATARFYTYTLCLLAGILLAACSPYFHQPFGPERARLGAEVNGNADMLRLPAAKSRTVVAVYKFRDQTGQYKPQANGSSFSTAITQGTTTILLRALEESGWFDPIERENLGNLLNERKIIRSTRAEFTEQTGVQQPVLPPLLFAGVMLEGGIISYDANMLTGGAGLRYFGAGASGQYRQDRVTVYLRAISTSNGRILRTVYTSKTILSQQIQGSLFRFVSFKRLMEAETGFTYNEPSEMAIKEAIEKAVQALIYEGIQDRLWLPKDSTEATGSKMLQYVSEREYGKYYDVLGRQILDRKKALLATISGGGQRYAGDFASPRITAITQLQVAYQPAGGFLNPYVAVGQSRLAARQFFDQKFYFTEAGVMMRVLPTDRFTPYLQLGGGVTTSGNSLSTVGAASRFTPHVSAGAGLEYQFSLNWSMIGGVDSRLFLRDDIDGADVGRYNDNSVGVRVGITYQLSARRKSPAAK
ncbi:CsgG/HfaB family protein [Hymenobacter lapidiphilus]|uniref:Curli production assembly/transport component CsgG n=1 Tax=Hymenobacter lapidiphilus TaxID=2608003 RepID=A0A7Y7PM40_9BACT|nr:CsgG/HfaB family protein [Hymenobacter lapidiphilus]NVO30310.1 curli production assembly/transport component CsgG [Hymenobacter lapidiphilus]